MGRRITDDKKGGVEFGKFRRNIMGTTSFEFKLPNMRKMQDFIVYPATSGDTSIMIQSGTRIGRINMSNGEGIMSQSHASGAYGVHLQFDKLIPFLLTADQLSALKEQVAKTAGSSVGSSVVKSDNSGADKFAKGGKLKPTYIPNENIESIKTRFGQTFSGKDVLDGAYVKGEVKTPKVTRYMFEEEEYEYADGGTMGSDALEAEIKTWIFRASGNIEDALRFVQYNSQVTSPFRLVYSAVRKGFIEPYQINADLLTSAIETSDDIDDTYADSGEGFGSSDMNAYIRQMISGAGITTIPKMAEGGNVSFSGISPNLYGNGKLFKVNVNWETVNGIEEDADLIQMEVDRYNILRKYFDFDEVSGTYSFDNIYPETQTIKFYKDKKLVFETIQSINWDADTDEGVTNEIINLNNETANLSYLYGNGYTGFDPKKQYEQEVKKALTELKNYPKMGVSNEYTKSGALNEVPDQIHLVTIITTDWNSEGAEHIFWGLEVRTQSGNYVRYIQNADDFLNFRSTLDSKDIKLMRDFNQEADRTKTNEIIDGLLMTEIPPIYTSYSNVQHYGGAEEGGWYYHTREAMEEVTEAQYLEIERERLDSYGEGVSASAGFIFGEDEKLGREYYS